MPRTRSQRLLALLTTAAVLASMSADEAAFVQAMIAGSGLVATLEAELASVQALSPPEAARLHPSRLFASASQREAAARLDTHVVQIGIHSFANSAPYRRWCDEQGIGIATMADENIAIGWESRGRALRTSNTYWGTCLRSLKSSTTSAIGWGTTITNWPPGRIS